MLRDKGDRRVGEKGEVFLGRENGDSAGWHVVASSTKASFDPIEQEQCQESQVSSGRLGGRGIKKTQAEKLSIEHNSLFRPRVVEWIRVVGVVWARCHSLRLSLICIEGNERISEGGGRGGEMPSQ